MTNFKKLAMCLSLVAVLGLPLAACSSTWQGMKNDWNDMTSSNETAPQEEMRTSGVEPAAGPASDSPSAWN